MQHVPKLTNLRALNVVHFRSNDTCPWVMRETRRFLVDTLSHHLELKLEWLAIDDGSVVRIIRDSPREDKPLDEDAKKESKSKKGKEKASTLNWSGSGYPFVSSNNNAWDSGSDSDDDTDPAAHAKLETIEGIHFYDVWDTRIFKKEVMAGRL